MANKFSDEDIVLEEAYKRALSVEEIKQDLQFYAFRSEHTYDPYEAAFKAGERNLAIRLLTLAGEIND